MEPRKLFSAGQMLKGRKNTYELLESIGHGRSGETWLAQTPDQTRVVVKLPLIDPDEVLETVLQRLSDLYAKFQYEKIALARLTGLDSAAALVDWGSHDVAFQGNDVAVLFMVQRLIDGVRLDQRMEALYSSHSLHQFHGRWVFT